MNVAVDVEGYAEMRRRKLIGTAMRLADKAKRTGKPFSMGEMPVNERRMIHMHLKDDREVRTESKGDGLYRKLVIFPRRSYDRGRDYY